tara:strand:+ start:1877 stop:3445 length:1569 start_codon:yes stop_codon:yes gene_type:complete
MIKWLSFLFTISLYSGLSQSELHYLITFENKSSEYSISAPEEYLSTKSINRRVAYQVDIDSTDLPINSNYIDSVKHLSLTLQAKSKWHNCIVVSCNSATTKDTLETYSFIKSVELIGEITLQKKFSIKLDYGSNETQIQAINLNFGHNLGYTGKEVEIAIIDAGFSGFSTNNYFDSLFINNRIKSTYDFVKNKEVNYTTHFHGTYVASILGANISGSYIGTAPEAKYHLLVSEDINQENKIEEFHLIEALEYCDSAGIDVINISLGYSTFDDVRFSHIKNELTGNNNLLTKACNMAWSRGAFIVTSAGNSGESSWGVVTVPANADSVLTVGAVDVSINYASFSSRGNPSVNSTLKPNIVGVGKAVYLVKDDGTIGISNGTSFSSPQISGLVSCLIQALPEKKNWEIKKAIESSGHKSMSPDSLVGHGIPNFEIAYEILKNNNYTGVTSNFKAYPNPSNGKIIISSYIPIKEISIYDTKGIQVYALKTNSETIELDLNHLSSGLYFIKGENQNNVKNVKIKIL